MADNKKDILKNAVAEYESIKEFAMKGAKKSLEKEFNSKLEEMLEKELSKNKKDKNIDESISVEKNGDKHEIEFDEDSVTIEKGDTKVTVGEDSEGAEGVTDFEDSESTEAPVGGEGDESDEYDYEDAIGGEEEEEMESEEEQTLYEIKEAIKEDDSDEMPNPYQKMYDMLEKIYNRLEGSTDEEGEAEGEVEIVDDEEVDGEEEVVSDEEVGDEEEIETGGDEEEVVIDDEGQEAADEEEVEEEPVEEEFDAEKFEGDHKNEAKYSEEDFLAEEDYDEEQGEVPGEQDTGPDEYQEEGEVDEEYEIVDEDEDEDFEEDEVEEMHGVSYSVSAKGQSSKFDGKNNPASNSKRINKESVEPKLRNQKDSKITEDLNKENESLKDQIDTLEEEISEYKNSFVDLRTQFHNMNTLNAKLALANKVLTNGGLTNDEKHAINEAFAEAENADEAKKVYKKIVQEHSISIKKSGLDKIRSNNMKVGQASEQESETLYESYESRRMSELAGIKTLEG